MSNKTKLSDRYFIALLESAPDSMVIIGSDGKIAMVNKQTEVLFGYRREEIIGKEVEILIPERYHKQHRNDRAKYISRPRTRPMGIGLELFGRRHDGSDFPVEVSLSPMHTDISEDTMIIAAIRDVTRQKQAQAELAKRTSDLEAINKELEAFSYSASHDLRAPLRTIEGFTNKILTESPQQLDGKAYDYFVRIMKASKQMGVLIDDMLKLARLTKIEMKPQCINISEIASSIGHELIDSDRQRAADIQIEPGITGYADRNLIQIALQNLFENAWKYTRKKEHTVIEFGTHGKNGGLVYFIKDNGVGFNMKYAGNLFKAFQRLHSSTDFEGTGVGLATVHRIIELHKGNIWAESFENTGTAFYFTLFPNNQDIKQDLYDK